jgi:hypothetical protein
MVVFCPKGEEGETIQKIKSILEDLKAEHICVSVGFAWEKTDLSPFENQTEVLTKAEQILEH